MKRLLSFVLGLTIITSLLIGGLLLLGRAEPIPQRIARLHLTDCALPCWDGLIPGVSNGSAAINQMSSTFPSLGTGSLTYPFLSWQSSSWSTGYTNISIGFDRQDRVVVVSISSTYAATVMPSFGEMLAIFGSPTCAMVDAKTGSTTLGYENGSHQLILQFTMSQPSPSSPVKSVSIGPSKTFSCQKATMTWHDFRHAQPTFYLAFPVGHF